MMTSRTLLLIAAATLAALPCHAADDDIDAALDLADATQTEARAGSDTKLTAEAAVARRELRAGGHAERSRLSLDYRLDTALSPQWRAVLADRLDADDPYRFREKDAVNVLKEAYVTWQPRSDRLFDLGRVNLRVGSGYAYNPTDFFKGGAIRSQTSADPESKRSNRMGTAMLRGQVLTEQGSFAVLVAPRITSHRSDDTFSPDFGATNASTRWQLSASHRFSDNLNPQLLVFGDKGHSPLLGLNMSMLFGSSVVGHLEWAGGRMAAQRSVALGEPEDREFRSRGVVGSTWTLPINLSITAEYHYNQAGLNAGEWQGLRSNPAAFGRYVLGSADQQELPTRRAAFVRAAWKDALWRRFDITAFVQRNLDDASQLVWGELRYRFDRIDLALQAQLNHGRAGTQYGVLPERRSVQLLADAYF